MYHCSSAIPDLSASFPYSIESLIPQSQAMVLLDRGVEIGEDYIVCELKVRHDGLFSTAEHTVPAWVGLEYMAQAIAAFSGYHRKRRGERIGLGFLLGARFFRCSVGVFPCGSLLKVRAEKIIEAPNDMSVFECKLEGETMLANAQLNVLLPRDSREFLARKGL